MADIKVKVGQQNAIKTRVGQQNSIKVISSISGSSGGVAISVIGGIADVTQLNVSGISTFIGIATFKDDVYIDGNLYIAKDITFDELSARNANITGILTVAQSIYYPIGEPYGVAYFNTEDKLVSSGTTASAIEETNYIFSTNSSGVPTWASVIDGGFY